MPPKKGHQTQEKTLWGRPGNTLKMGIVGLPNVGKSSTFNILAKLNVPAQNYPFCTIDPNKAVVSVPDPRFTKLCEMWKPKSQVTAVLSVVDIAGLVRGASKGQGLGNHFLSNIKQVDGIYHVVRTFQDQQVSHTQAEINPIRDMQIINQQLVLKDLQYINNRIQQLDKQIKRTNNKQAKQQQQILQKAKNLLTANKWVRNGQWSNKQISLLNPHRLITTKQVVYLINLSDEDFINKKNKWLKKIKQFIDNNVPGQIIPFSAHFQKQHLNDKDQNKRTMIPKIIKAGYHALDLIYFFTAGQPEVRCWTIRKNVKAPQAAGVIHTDFQKGFICAEVMKYNDFVQLGSENAVKAQGKYRQQGKDYVVEDGDIILYRFNVGKGGK